MTAPKQKSVEDGGILLCDSWKLFPVDSSNWELCELRDGAWRRRGRFYQYNTVGEAMAYVADELMKAKAHGAHMELQDALREYREISDGLRKAVAR